MPDSTQAESEKNGPVRPRRPNRAPHQRNRKGAGCCRVHSHALSGLDGQGFARAQDGFRVTQLIQSIQRRIDHIEGVAAP